MFELTLDFAGTANDQTFGYSGYNPAGQLLERTSSKAIYDAALGATGTDAYTANGLNQYLDIASTSPTYDGNGNITEDHRGWDYAYSAENQLSSVKDGSTTLAAYRYSSEGMIRARGGPSAAASFFYDGDQEIMEKAGWNGENGVNRLYVRIPGSVDQPFLMIDYTGSGCSAGCEEWALTDERGSVVATADDTGAKKDIYKYGVYGEPAGSASGFPFRFTGQKLDADTGLYYYKARFYDPEAGRFLQTDPIGYGDGLKMYAYAGNNPVNGSDPSGLMVTDEVVVHGTTIRTARSRTSGEYLRRCVFSVMAPSSQEWEPPANPGRFTP